MNRLIRNALFLLAFQTFSAAAATFVVPEDKTLVERADAIVIATVLSNYTELSAIGAIQTVTPISIEEVLKGDLLPSVIAVREPGGRHGDRITAIPGIPQFAPGERVLLFLTSTPRRDWAVTEIALGKFTFAFDINGNRIAIRQEHDINGWDLDGAPHREQRREATRFVRYIRDVVAQRKGTVDYFVGSAPIKAVTINGLQPKAEASGFSPTSYTMDMDGGNGTGKGARWAVFPSQVNWTNTNTMSNAPNGGVDAINAAMAAWDNECQSNVNYVRVGSDPSKNAGLSAPDGANTVIWERDLSAYGISGPYVCNTGGTLGLGGITTASTPLNTLGSESFWTIKEGDVEFRMGVNACASYVQSANFLTAVAHELGHTLGFRHSDQNRARPARSCGSTPGLECSSAAVMNSVVPNGLNGNLTAWDVNGVSTLYPGGTCGTGSRVRGDFNGDGRADIFWRSPNEGFNYLWFLNGATLVASTPVASGDVPWKVAASGDFNGDGKSDIFWRRDTGENYLWLMDGAIVVTSAAMPSVFDVAWKVAGAGDFNGDGKADLFWRHDSSGQNSIWILNGTSVPSMTATLAAPDAGWRVAGIGDFNADGKDDVFWHRDSGENYMWLMNGTTVASSTAMPSSSDTTWRIAAIRDFNGDGMADVFWHRDSGENYMWLIDRTTVAASLSVLDTGDTAWKIAAAADFNGDGKSDIFWHRDTGENYVWLLNGATVQLSAALPTAASMWRVVAPTK